MPKYGQTYVAYTTSTSVRTALSGYMITDTTRNVEIVEAMMTGSGDLAPADVQHRAGLVGNDFAGATGASSLSTPVHFNDIGGTAAIGNFGENLTIEPAIAAAVVVVTFGFNQRGGMRWAVPQGEGVSFLNAGAGENGYTWGVISSVAGEVDANLHFWQAQ